MVDAAGPGSTVLIVGASTGIGRECALTFARRGDRLVLSSRSEEALEQAADACRAAGAAEVLVRPVDVADREAVDAVFDEAVEHLGGLDVVVASAAVTAFGRFEDLPPEVFDAVVQTDVIGTSNVARAAVRHLRARGSGHLVLLGSMLGHAAMPYQAPYVMSKFAISALIRILRQENRDRPGVAVHGIYPGPVDTPIYTDSANYLGREVQVPPPADKPETVARAVLGAVTSEGSRDRSVGWANAAAVLAFRLVPRLYDAVIAPGLRAAAFTKRAVPTSPGNVLQAADRSRSRPEESRLRH